MQSPHHSPSRAMVVQAIGFAGVLVKDGIPGGIFD
jgi:hypothetical protein